ncbi:MAG: hypothetical protein IT438_03810, partial [Phycisphaerales bacterium]|nr:hypothetical protein [Phycisphaerales bacterium]
MTTIAATISPRFTARQCIDAACAGTGITLDELVATRRHPSVTHAREIAAYLCRTYTRLSYPQIAQAMGRPNHSSVITMLQRARARMAVGDTEFTVSIQFATEYLTGERKVRAERAAEPPTDVEQLIRAERRVLAAYRKLFRVWFPDAPGEWTELEGTPIKGDLYPAMLDLLNHVEGLYRRMSDGAQLAVLPRSGAT